MGKQWKVVNGVWLHPDEGASGDDASSPKSPRLKSPRLKSPRLKAQTVALDGGHRRACVSRAYTRGADGWVSGRGRLRPNRQAERVLRIYSHTNRPAPPAKKNASVLSSRDGQRALALLSDFPAPPTHRTTQDTAVEQPPHLNPKSPRRLAERKARFDGPIMRRGIAPCDSVKMRMFVRAAGRKGMGSAIERDLLGAQLFAMEPGSVAAYWRATTRMLTEAPDKASLDSPDPDLAQESLARRDFLQSSAGKRGAALRVQSFELNFGATPAPLDESAARKLRDKKILAMREAKKRTAKREREERQRAEEAAHDSDHDPFAAKDDDEPMANVTLLPVNRRLEAVFEVLNDSKYDALVSVHRLVQASSSAPVVVTPEPGPVAIGRGRVGLVRVVIEAQGGQFVREVWEVRSTAGPSVYLTTNVMVGANDFFLPLSEVRTVRDGARVVPSPLAQLGAVLDVGFPDLFNKPGNEVEMSLVRRRLASGVPLVACKDGNVPAMLMKQWIRGLPVALLANLNNEAFQKGAESAASARQELTDMLTSDDGRVQLDTLMWIFDMLRKVVAHPNGLGAREVAQLISPNLDYQPPLSANDAADPERVKRYMQRTVLVIDVVKALCS